jgi:arylsulfatase
MSEARSGMSRRLFPPVASASLVLLAASVAAPVEAGEVRPNILFLMADQCRADFLGAEAGPAARTPSLDRLAAEGIRFRCAYSSTPSCTPARAAILTGFSPWRHGMLGYGKVAARYPDELPRGLADAGYECVGIGKMHFDPQRNLHGFHRTILDESGRVESPGFLSDHRRWFREQAPGLNPDATGIGWNDYRAKAYALPERLHPTRWTADEAVRWIEERKDERPFFLMVSFARPHSPYDPPERFLAEPGIPDPPPAAVGAWARRNDRPIDPKDFNLWRGNLGADQVRRSRAAYRGSIRFIDEGIGRILAALEARGLLGKTLIVFTSDHGDMLGDHHLWRKTYPYEGSARIPLFVRPPDGTPGERGRVLDAPVELRDILPTLWDAAGIAIDERRFDGRSLLGLIRGGAKGWREWIDLEHSRCYGEENRWSALTDGKWKYVLWAATGEEQLFHLAEDPGELRDLAPLAEHEKELALWRAKLIEHLSVRGEGFVREGKLVAPRKDLLYSPHYPKKP